MPKQRWEPFSPIYALGIPKRQPKNIEAGAVALFHFLLCTSFLLISYSPNPAQLRVSVDPQLSTFVQKDFFNDGREGLSPEASFLAFL